MVFLFAINLSEEGKNKTSFKSIDGDNKSRLQFICENNLNATTCEKAF